MLSTCLAAAAIFLLTVPFVELKLEVPVFANFAAILLTVPFVELKPNAHRWAERETNPFNRTICGIETQIYTSPL